MKILYFDSIFHEIIPDGPIDNKFALVQVMAGRHTGDEPLAEPILTKMPEVLQHD